MLSFFGGVVIDWAVGDFSGRAVQVLLLVVVFNFLQDLRD